MGSYIKGMEKPKSCDQCPISLWALPKTCCLEIESCPITEVKTPHGRLPQMETKTETQNSNVISVYDGVSEAVRCAMCSNPNKSDRGCDGACSYDEKLYERIMKAIAGSIADTPQTEVTTDCRQTERIEQ